MKRTVSAKTRLPKIFTAGIASNTITHDGIKPGDRVILCLRLSKRQQARNENFGSQEAFLRAEMEKRGAIVVDVIRRVRSGTDPGWIAYASVLAKKHGTKLVAVSADRFIRNSRFESNVAWKQELRATELELKELERAADGVKLVTILHPDAPLEECLRIAQMNGRNHKDKKGGRPKKIAPGAKKEIRQLNKSKLFWLRAAGFTNKSEIARMLGTHESNIRRWWKELDDDD